MNATDVIVSLVVIAIVGSAILYILRAKKKGRRCIGCPNSDKCGGNCGSCKSNKSE